MTLTTAATATLDRSQYTTQILGVRAELGVLPSANVARVCIAAGVEVDVEPGADASVELDGGDGAATVITGRVAHVARHADGTVVTVTDAGSALSRTRPFETYEGLPVAQVIARLADTAGVDLGLVIALTQTASYVGHARRSAAEHVAALAKKSGAVAYVDAEGRLVVAPWPVGLPSVAMREDREFLSLNTTLSSPAPEVVPVGAGGSGVALMPDAWVPSTEAVTTGGEPDGTRRWQVDHLLRAQLDVRLASDGAAARRTSGTARMYGSCWLQPSRRPGDVVQIQESTAPGAAGPWLLTKVSHVLTWTTSVTFIHGVAGGDPRGTAGVLAGAVGELT